MPDGRGGTSASGCPLHPDALSGCRGSDQPGRFSEVPVPGQDPGRPPRSGVPAVHDAESPLDQAAHTTRTRDARQLAVSGLHLGRGRTCLCRAPSSFRQSDGRGTGDMDTPIVEGRLDHLYRGGGLLAASRLRRWRLVGRCQLAGYRPRFLARRAHGLHGVRLRTPPAVGSFASGRARRDGRHEPPHSLVWPYRGPAGRLHGPESQSVLVSPVAVTYCRDLPGRFSSKRHPGRHAGQHARWTVRGTVPAWRRVRRDTPARSNPLGQASPADGAGSRSRRRWSGGTDTS